MIAVLILLALACHCSEGQQQRQSQQENRPRRFNGRQGPRIKRMYALCPPQFERIGNECYFLSKTKVNWLDAQFQCLDRDSKLAEPNKVDDRRLRKHLLDISAGEIEDLFTFWMLKEVLNSNENAFLLQMTRLRNCGWAASTTGSTRTGSGATMDARWSSRHLQQSLRTRTGK